MPFPFVGVGLCNSADGAAEFTVRDGRGADALAADEADFSSGYPCAVTAAGRVVFDAEACGG